MHGSISIAAAALRDRDPQPRGFNYGQPINLPLPPEWQAWERIADEARLAHCLDIQKAWAYDMALRDVRIATTREQWDRAIAKCREVFPEPDTFERVSQIALPEVQPTAENATDAAIREHNILRLIAAARRAIEEWNWGEVHGSEQLPFLEDALLPFANVDTTET